MTTRSRIAPMLAKGAMRMLLGGACSIVTMVVVLSGYVLCKQQPFATPVRLELTALDRAIPFLPWTVWIYSSMSQAIFAAWVLVPNMRMAWRLMAGLALAAVICWCFFAFFPTTYPRELFPLPRTFDSAIMELAEVRRLDDPTNCFPSMHVALACCLALTMLEYDFSWPARATVMLWGITINLSTLTTKQHYVVDVLGGAVTGIVAYALVRRAATTEGRPIWNLGFQPITLTGMSAREVIAKIRRKMPERGWSVAELPWPKTPPKKLTPSMVHFVSQVIYVEEIAGKGFDLLAAATTDEDLRTLYNRFGEDERRHAEGLRHLLHIHGEDVGPPGLGCALLLQQFDSLDPKSDSDAMLVAMSIPVFETFLDAGTIPFLRGHPALGGEAFEQLIRNICRDESSHLAVNWNVARSAAKTVKSMPFRSWGGLRFLLNPAVIRGTITVPALSMDVYGYAYGLGFDFRALFGPFKRIFSLHRMYSEFAWFPSWFLFRVFAVCGMIATVVVLLLDRLVPFILRLITKILTGMLDRLALAYFPEKPVDSRNSSSTPFVAEGAAVGPSPAVAEGEIQCS